LIFYSEKGLGIKIKGIGLRKPLLATLVMGIFLYTFSSYVDINLFTGIIEVLLGAIIYFGVLIWSNGLNKEDWTLLKGLIKKT